MKFINIIENLYEKDVIYKKGVYISLKVSEESKKEINKWQEKYLKGTEYNKNDLHLTLIYSKKEHKERIETSSYKIPVIVTEYDIYGEEGNECLVAKVKSEELLFKNSELVNKYGFISDFPNYEPHITLSYNMNNIQINSLPIIDFVIELEEETIAEINKDWKTND